MSATIVESTPEFAGIVPTKLLAKLSRIHGSLPEIGMTKKDRGRAYADNNDILSVVTPALSSELVHMASDVDRGSVKTTISQRPKVIDEGSGETKMIETVRVELMLVTTITDTESGEQTRYYHPGIGEDDGGENAVKQANTTARGIMLRSVFPLRFKASAAGSGTGDGGNARGSTGAQRNPATEFQVARIKVLASAREIELGSDQMRELLKRASNGFARGIGIELMSYRDAESLIKLIAEIPLPRSQAVSPGLAEAPAPAATASPATAEARSAPAAFASAPTGTADGQNARPPMALDQILEWVQIEIDKLGVSEGVLQECTAAVCAQLQLSTTYNWRELPSAVALRAFVKQLKSVAPRVDAATA